MRQGQGRRNLTQPGSRIAKTIILTRNILKFPLTTPTPLAFSPAWICWLQKKLDEFLYELAKKNWTRKRAGFPGKLSFLMEIFFYYSIPILLLTFYGKVVFLLLIFYSVGFSSTERVRKSRDIVIGLAVNCPFVAKCYSVAWFDWVIEKKLESDLHSIQRPDC